MKALDLAGKQRLPAPREGGKERGREAEERGLVSWQQGGSLGTWAEGQGHGPRPLPDSLGPRRDSSVPRPGSSLVLQFWRLGAPLLLHCSHIPPLCPSDPPLSCPGVPCPCPSISPALPFLLSLPLCLWPSAPQSPLFSPSAPSRLSVFLPQHLSCFLGLSRRLRSQVGGGGGQVGEPQPRQGGA